MFNKLTESYKYIKLHVCNIDFCETIKWPCANWGICFQRTVADKHKQIECSSWFYLNALLAFNEIETNKPKKNYVGEH